MFNNYTFLPNGNIVAYDDKKGAIVRPNHDKIEEELITQNEIDYLEREIEDKKRKLNSNPSIKEIKNDKLLLFIYSTIYFICIVPLFKWAAPNIPITNHLILNNLPWIKTSSDLFITFFATIGVVNFTLSYIKVHFSNKKKIANVLKLENTISVLTQELSKKQDELKKLTLEKKGNLEIDSNIHDIEKTNYNVSVNHEIEVLNSYLDSLLKKNYNTPKPQDVDENKVKDVKRLVLVNTNQKKL